MTDDRDYQSETVDIANWDQHHAEAIDLLRGAPVFILAVPAPDEPMEGAIKIHVIGGGDHFDVFHDAVRAGMAGGVPEELEELHRSMIKWLRRDRWIRAAMLAAVAVNLTLVAINASEAWWR